MPRAMFARAGAARISNLNASQTFVWEALGVIVAKYTNESQLDELMCRVADGDRAATEPLFKILLPIVVRFIRKNLNGSQDAEDLAQQVMIKIFSQAHKFDRSLKTLPWVFTIAHFECKTHNRKIFRGREDSVAHIADHSNEHESPEEKTIQSNLKKALRDVLDDLSENELEVIMASLEEQDRPDIAGPAFRKRLQRAMAQVKGAWRKRHGN